VLRSLGQADKALSCYERAVEMCEKLYPVKTFPDGHPDLARSLTSFGVEFNLLGQPDKALSCYERAMQMYARLLDREAATAPESEALALAASFPESRTFFLFTSGRVKAADAATYAALWPTRAAVTRILQRRHAAALLSDADRERAAELQQRLRVVRQ